MTTESDQVKAIQALLANGSFKAFIKSIRFPRYNGIKSDTTINFTSPITVLVGANGTRKSTVLRVLDTAPKGKDPAKYWFSSSTDPILDIENKQRQSFVYTHEKDGKIHNVLYVRQDRKEDRDPDYWETAKPTKTYGLVTGSERGDLIEMESLYINFRSIISAFDKCFYFFDEKKDKRFRTAQQLIRHKSKYLYDILLRGKQRIFGTTKINDKPIEFTNDEIKIISDILDKDYSALTYVRHKLFDGWGDTIKLQHNNFIFTDAYAGSGETSVAKMVLKIERASPNSLILLDEPETSLHPSAQHKLKQYILSRIIEKKHQVIISTHSEVFVNGLDKSSIKVFRLLSDGTTDVIENVEADEAFHILGSVFVDVNKTRIYVEDRLVKSLLDEALKLLNKASLYDILILPGKDILIKDYSNNVLNKAIDKGKTFYLLDGDARPKWIGDLPDNVKLQSDFINWGSLTIAQTEDKDFLRDIVKKQCDSVPYKDNQLNLYGPFFQKFSNSIKYLPSAFTPEQLLWDDKIAHDVIEQFGEDQDVKSTLDKLQSTQDFKQKFRILTESITSDDTSQLIATIHRPFIRKYLNEQGGLDSIKQILDEIVQARKLLVGKG